MSVIFSAVDSRHSVQGDNMLASKCVSSGEGKDNSISSREVMGKKVTK